jgi:hypothetical protein
MLRTIALSLLMLVTVLSMLPVDQSTAHGLRQTSASQGRQRVYRRHSRAWWRRYRARLRRRRAAALAHRRARLAPKLPQAIATGAPPTLITTLPIGWNTETKAKSSEMRFTTGSVNGSVPGQAALEVVAQSRPNPGYLTQREERRMLAGTAVTDLRRIVIDKMITAGGWVVNDYQRDMAGYRVFVVIAETPGDARSPEKSWNFYFTELNGRIYSLTTNTPRQFSERMAADAEKFILSLHTASNSSSSFKR